VIKELALRGRGYCGLGEDIREWETENWDWGLVILKFVLEVSLVEDVSFGVLDEEDDATVMDW
jgi:hypothetical protein